MAFVKRSVPQNPITLHSISYWNDGLDQLRKRYEEIWDCDAADGLQGSFWVGAFWGDELVGALGYFDSQVRAITCVLSGSGRRGIIACYVLMNWVADTTPVGLRVAGNVLANNTTQRRLLEQYGGQVHSLVYVAER